MCILAIVLGSASLVSCAPRRGKEYYTEAFRTYYRIKLALHAANWEPSGVDQRVKESVDRFLGDNKRYFSPVTEPGAYGSVNTLNQWLHGDLSLLPEMMQDRPDLYFGGGLEGLSRLLHSEVQRYHIVIDESGIRAEVEKELAEMKTSP